MFEGDTGRVATWADLMEGVCWADVILIGELHGDVDIHAFQRALVEDCAASFPGTVLSLEMLERDEQPILDRWLDHEIDTETFVLQTNSRNWAGTDSWSRTYQPVLEAARENDAHIVAANAPRRYVRQARLQGYPAVESRPLSEHAYFAIPTTLQMNGYSDRFASEMRTHSEGRSDEEAIEATFRAQAMWDATMARSIAEARSRGAVKVVHLVGRFHTDFDGGTVQELRKRAPLSKVLVISCVESEELVLAEDDRGRADLILHTPLKPQNTSEQESVETPNDTTEPS